LIQIEKQFRDGKPVTHLMLTAQGRRALEAHARKLVAAISHRRLAVNSSSIEAEPAPASARESPSHAEEWID
jgi:hypothetical protein